MLKVRVSEHVMELIMKILNPVAERKVIFEILKLAFFRFSEEINSNYTYNQMEDEIAISYKVRIIEKNCMTNWKK